MRVHDVKHRLNAYKFITINCLTSLLLSLLTPSQSTRKRRAINALLYLINVLK